MQSFIRLLPPMTRHYTRALTEVDEPGFIAADLYTTRTVQTKSLTQNTYNTQNPTEQGNCANSAYRDAEAESSKCWKPLMRRSSCTGGRFLRKKRMHFGRPRKT